MTVSNHKRDAERQRKRKHGHQQLRRTCDCELCAAYSRGYKAGAQGKYNKRTRDADYGDDIMGDLLP